MSAGWEREQKKLENFLTANLRSSSLIKITGNTQTYQRMIEDMDFNAGRVLTGEISLAEAGDELFGLVTRVAAGEPAKPELLGHREYFVMYKHQDTPSLAAGCRA